ncbi:MAG: hypothetical protein QOF60_873 [Actinomycetota bacterium]|nr:hypothetical protein [Actinomycetota bacterium]
MVFVLTVALMAGAVGWAWGSRDPRPGRSSVDVGFLYDMIAHHEQAILMANLETAAGADPTALAFAREIVRSQSYEIGLMERRLADFGYSPDDAPTGAMGWMGRVVPLALMPGMASDDELALLDSRVGPEADALFLALMKDHHAGGVHMAEDAAVRAHDPWIRDLAARIARNQRVEVREYEQARIRAGLPERPVGFTANVEMPPPRS